MNILFLLPVVSQARYHKRISALTEIGTKPNILAFERDYYKGKVFPTGYTCLGKIQHGKYYKRFLPFIKSLYKVRHAAKQAEVIYAFGFDVLLLGWLSQFSLRKKIKFVCEVGDIRGAFLEKCIYSSLLRLIERAILKQIDLLVVTSKAYVTGYYKGIQGLHNIKYHVIENKIDRDKILCWVNQQKNKKEDVIRLGYFGVIRCRRSWEILKKVVRKGKGRIRLYVRGIAMGIENFEEEARTIDFIDYGGDYVSPDDLPYMYGAVDMVWACYPYQGISIGNWQWARTNRFYEACFFKKPMFVQAGAEDNRVVANLGLGLSIDLLDVEGTVDRILKVTEKELTQWRRNIVQLPKNIYIYTNEHEQLIELLQ